MTTHTLIVGAGEADRRPRPGRTATDLALEATMAALDDSGLEMGAIDCVLTGHTVAEHHLDFSAIVAQELGLRPKLSGGMSRSGATGTSLVASAAMALQSGSCDTVLALWADNRVSAPEVDVVSTFASLFTPYESAYGPLIATHYALLANRFMADHGVTPQQMASVAVAFREHASRNPQARYQQPITVDEVLASPMVSTPLHRLECTLVTDFGGAVIMTRKDRAHQFKDPIEVLGWGQSVTHDSILCDPSLFGPGYRGVRDAGERAYAMAGLRPQDIEMTQLYDCFTITVLLELEGLGFCKPGQAGAAVAEGLLGRDGPLPTNTNGGMLSCANGGILHLTEAVAQMRGTAGPRQLPRRPRTALVHGNGGILASHATVILGQG
ncbi:MAG: thiolase family protein [Betaproteobacteria bacterium]